MRSKAPLALMEQLVMALVFALSAAVCVRAFALADTQSRRSEARDRAVVAAEDLAETWKARGGDARSAASALGGTADGDGWTVLYGADWSPLPAGQEDGALYRAEVLPQPETVPGLRRADVRVWDGEDRILASFSVACQTEAAP